MPSHREQLPPAWLRRLIARCLPREDREPMLRELDEVFAGRVRRHGRRTAVAWYSRQAVGFASRVWSLRAAGWPHGDALAMDVRDAWRAFWRRPAYALAFVVTLAVSTGLLASVYSAARWVLLRPVPGVTDPGTLITLRIGSTEAPAFVSWEASHPDYLTLRDRLPVQGGLAARTPIDVDLRPGGGEPVRVSGEMVTANYFSVAGARLQAGRAFLPEEDRTDGDPVVILAHALARQLSPDPVAVVGTDVSVNGRPLRVVGVAAPGFRGVELPGAASLWLPLAARGLVDPSSGASAPTRSEGTWRRLVARLPDGTSHAQVEAAAAAAVQAIRSESGAHSFMATHQRVEVFPGVGLDPSVRSEIQRTLGRLAIAAGLLLLLAMANLGNLALIEGTRRERETAVRLAIGAGRGTLVRRSLVESTVLGLCSAALALGLASAAGRWFSGTRLSAHGGSLEGIQVDLPLAGAVLVVAWMVAALVALRASGGMAVGPAGSLGARSGTGSARTHRARAGLVAVQVAVSVVLLVAAGLLGRTVANLRDVDLGFDPGRVMTFAIDPHLHGYESTRLARLTEEIGQAFAQEPGVTGSGFISPVPLRGSFLTAPLFSSGDAEARPYIGAAFFASAGLLPALGARVVAGEDPWRGDSGTVVLTRTAAALAFPGVAPSAVVGQLVPTRARGRGLVRIASVIEDLHLSDVTRDAPGLVIRPLSERYAGLSLTGMIAGPDAARLAPVIQRVVSERAPDLPVFAVQSARSLVDLQFTDRRAMARAATAMGGIGLVLAMVGLYGVLAAMVGARRREFGVRSALGEGPGAIGRRVLVIALAPVVTGLLAGTIVAVAAARWLASLLFGLAPLDALTFLGACVVLLAVALAGAIVPAVRAMRVSPVEILRE